MVWRLLHSLCFVESARSRPRVVGSAFGTRERSGGVRNDVIVRRKLEFGDRAIRTLDALQNNRMVTGLRDAKPEYCDFDRVWVEMDEAMNLCGLWSARTVSLELAPCR